MNNEEEDKRIAVRRGSEHVRIKGTTEELGEIIPAPVVVEDQHVEIADDDDEEGARR